jgi:hypothetical protein
VMQKRSGVEEPRNSKTSDWSRAAALPTVFKKHSAGYKMATSNTGKAKASKKSQPVVVFRCAHKNVIHDVLCSKDGWRETDRSWKLVLQSIMPEIV